jgi:hypothetical protein
VYTSKGYRGFESLSLRSQIIKFIQKPVNHMFTGFLLVRHSPKHA